MFIPEKIMAIFEDKKRVLVFVSLIIAIILLIILIIFWFLNNRQVDNQTPPPDDTINAPVVPSVPNDISQATPDMIAQNNNYPLDLRQLAMSFAERFGSYSTDEPQENLLELAPLMTAQLNNALAGKRQTEENGTFIGFTTKALSTELVNLSSNQAQAIVKVQRIQTLADGRGEPIVFYADLKLDFLKVGNDWLVDGANWQ